jgi:flavodoxin/NAD-dependent dihydropyrimidine dehydrogenase PreA subunit
MKSLIIYYSQTGNTRKIARAIHKGMSQVAEQCDIVPLKKVKYEDLPNYDLIGIGSPIWFAETPNVTFWLDGLPHQQGKHAFFFSTHGTLPILYAPIMARKLKIKDFTVIGWNDWYGGNQVEGSPAWFTDGHPDDIDLKEAEDFGREMVATSRRISAGETELIPPLPDMPAVSFQVLDLLLRAIHKIPGFSVHGTFTYDREKCNYPKCRICVDNCTMGYIDFSTEPRKFGSEGDKCTTACTFCEQICPTGAITQSRAAMNSTLQPETRRLADIARIEDKNAFMAAIDEAEAQGRFRRLIPKEKVGLPTPSSTDHIKRPRFKLPKDEE